MKPENIQKSVITDFSNIDFSYEIIVKSNCPMFASEPFKSEMKNLNEMVITSLPFSDHLKCSSELINALSGFMEILERITDIRYVLATKINPMHQENYVESEDNIKEGWDETIVLNIHVADADALNERSTVVSSVSAIVRTSVKIHDEHLNMTAYQQ